MKLKHIAIILSLTSAFAALALTALAVFAYHQTQPKTIVWDIRTKPLTQEDLGWHPKGSGDILFYIHDDIDFTRSEVGVMRNGLKPTDHHVSFTYAHFAKDVTVEQGIQIAVQVLNDWCGGIRESFEPLPRGDLTIEQFRQAIRDGKYYEMDWGIDGRGTASVTLTLFEGRSAGLQGKCSLTFQP